MTFRTKIDTTALIEEVKKRPCLYEIRNVRGIYHEKRNAAWGEIGCTLFSDKWNELSPADKDVIVKDLQVKWKSLRDSFTRHLRIKEQIRHINPQVQKRFLYMDQLAFLMPIFQKGDKPVLSEDSKDSNDSLYTSEDTKPLANIACRTDRPEASTSHDENNLVPIHANSFSPNNLNPCEVDSRLSFLGDSEPPMKKVAKCLEELTSLQKEDKFEDPMGNKKFLLSLLPFMKKLPDDVNLEVRLQLMSVLETYTIGKNFQH